MKNDMLSIILLLATFVTSCAEKSTNEKMEPDNETDVARIQEVTTSGSENAYTFSVTISAPDTGCDQYVDWWEVVSEKEELLYRRILAHSHLDEQPFTRAGGKVAVSKDQIVIVRMHMNNTGYSQNAMSGSVSEVFDPVLLEAGFANELANEQPLPNGCTF